MRSVSREKKNTKKIGDIGENIAAQYLKKNGFKVTKRNYWKKWGEIDIVAEKGNTIHFVEVKSVSRENVRDLKISDEAYRPEENVHPQKLKRLNRAIESYLAEHDERREWVIDVVAVFLDQARKEARCRMTENVSI